MRDDGVNLKLMRAELDVSVMEIAQAADLHWQTVYKALDGVAGRNSEKRVRKVLREMQAQLKSKSKVAG